MSGAAALAEVLAFKLKTDDPRKWKRLDALRCQHEQEGHSPTVALTRAVNDLTSKQFQMLQVRCSQAMRRSAGLF